MKNKLSSKYSKLLIPLLILIGIICYVLIIFSFDSIEETSFDMNYFFILPLFFIGILSSGLYSIIYYKKSFVYDLSFGITRKNSYLKYLKTIIYLLVILLIFTFIYLFTIFIYLLFKQIEFIKIINLLIAIIEQEMLIDLVSYYIISNGLIVILNHIIKKELYLVCLFIGIIFILGLFNLFLGILNLNIILNIIFLLLGILLLAINYLIIKQRKF